MTYKRWQDESGSFDDHYLINVTSLNTTIKIDCIQDRIKVKMFSIVNKLKWSFLDLIFFVKMRKFYPKYGETCILQNGKISTTIYKSNRAIVLYLHGECPQFLIVYYYLRENKIIPVYDLFNVNGDGLIAEYGQGLSKLYPLRYKESYTLNHSQHPLRYLRDFIMLYDMNKNKNKYFSIVDIYTNVINIEKERKQIETYIKTIQSAWRRCISNPEYFVCRQRLRKEFGALRATREKQFCITTVGL